MTNTNHNVQAVQANQQNDGRSFKMRGFEQLKISFRMARIVLLLLMVAAIGAVHGHAFPVWLGFRGGKDDST